MSLGGTKEVRGVNNDEVDMVLALKPKVEEKTGKTSAFEPTKICTQTVAGTNYFVKVAIGDGWFVHLRIHKPLSGEPTLQAVQTGKKADDELGYFEA